MASTDNMSSYKPEIGHAVVDERIDFVYQKLEYLQAENKKISFSLNDYALKSEVKK